MKVRQVVDMTPTTATTSWQGVYFSDGTAEINIELNDKQIIDLAESLNNKVKRIMENRLEEARKSQAEVDSE